MPFYRIVIWTRQRTKPFTGIRHMENHNINSVYLQTLKKVEAIYKQDFMDVEVQLLPKNCTAVKKYLENIERKREEKRWPVSSQPPAPALSRKEYAQRQKYGD